MKKIIIYLLIIYSPGLYSQSPDMIDMIINSYIQYYELENTSIVKAVKLHECLSEPDDFADFFDSQFIKSSDIKRIEYYRNKCKDENFEFADVVRSPLKQSLKKTSGYGMREFRKKREMHYGVDFELNEKDTVCSVFCGRVFKTGEDEGYGNYVVIRHYNMTETLYAHLESVLVEENQVVVAGEPVGLGGSTGRSSGCHLHFELRYKGFCMIDPISALNGKFLGKIDVL